MLHTSFWWIQTDWTGWHLMTKDSLYSNKHSKQLSLTFKCLNTLNVWKTSNILNITSLSYLISSVLWQLTC